MSGLKRCAMMDLMFQDKIINVYKNKQIVFTGKIGRVSEFVGMSKGGVFSAIKNKNLTRNGFALRLAKPLLK